jgi:trans-aconitate 2-methyltransferase
MASIWNPQQYDKFRNERSAPFYDLLALVRPVPGGRVADLGCGTGALTADLHRHSQAAETIGIDSSETMLAEAAGHAGEGLRFEQRDIAAFAPARPFDVVFSNAALQWVDAHEQLFTRITHAVAPGGQLAVQVPANADHPSHVAARAVAEEEPFASAMGGYTRTWPVQSPEWYAELLDRLGYAEQSVRLQVYGHHLPSREAVIEWVRGTYLTDYQRRMPDALFEQYLARYREVLLPQLDDRRPFFYAFKRILIWGRRA